MRRHSFRAGSIVLLSLALHASVAAVSSGQVPAGSPLARPESVTVVPGAIYHAGAFGRFLFGDHHRDLWTSRLTVSVLSLEHFAGGLRPIKRGGSRQTRSLRLAGADGREYVFRSVDKDPSLSLPPELRGTYASRIMRDLISAAHPGGALIVAGMLDATGVLHVTPHMALMPDDPRLGEFRAEFANVLGIIEERPADASDDDAFSFAGASKVVSSEKLFERITEHADEQVDARAFLSARLFDLFVGDWDRHPDQWRWARFGDAPSDRWQPIPRDRDWAFVKLDGVVWGLAREVYPFPQFVTFEESYPDVVWLSWNGRRLDRRLLSELAWPTWDSVAVALRDRMSDAAIDAALQRLPTGLAGAGDGTLRRTLRTRRDGLTAVARRYYLVLADQVELHATDESEVVQITRLDERTIEVAIRQRTRSGAPRARAWFSRRFDANETSEIRVFLHGGEDRVEVRGESSGRTLVRVIGGGGANTFTDVAAASSASRTVVVSAAKDLRVYDTNPRTTIDATLGDIDRRPFAEPTTRRGWIDPPRDWGSRWRPLPWVSYSPVVGLFVGGGPLYKRYGFRLHPYSYSSSFLFGYATGAGRFRAQYETDVRRANSGIHGTLVARYSGIDILRYYGYGNETIPVGSSRFHAVDQSVLSVDPMLHFPLAANLELSVGASMRYATTSLDSGRFIATAKPYGTGPFGQLGARQRMTYDSRDIPQNATHGLYFTVDGAEYPAVWSSRGSFGRLRSEASTYLSAPIALQPVLAFRAGGEKVWGEFPFSDAAFIGGPSTVRGLEDQRFAGSGSLYGNAELRVFLTRVFFLLPADLGAFGLADAGRVYLTGEQSDLWHTGFGGGLWLSFLGRANTFSAAMARSRERNGFYFRTGMSF